MQRAEHKKRELASKAEQEAAKKADTQTSQVTSTVNTPETNVDKQEPATAGDFIPLESVEQYTPETTGQELVADSGVSKTSEQPSAPLSATEADEHPAVPIPADPCFVISTRTSRTSRLRCMTISLDGMLDYNENDYNERTFEVCVVV